MSDKMGQNSNIEWTHHTFNPWVGCTKVSEGCKFCYAETLMDHRYHKTKWGPHGLRVIKADAGWREPLKWNRDAEAAGERHRVFCASLADVFEGPETMPDSAIAGVRDARLRLMRLIEKTQHLNWLLLTKRPENWRQCLLDVVADGCGEPKIAMDWLEGKPPANVWVGVSVENELAAHRIYTLRGIPAVIRFLSIEPLIGPLSPIKLGGISWVIVGGESGPNARPIHPQWARDIRDQCKAEGVPFFFKQWGEYAPDNALPPMKMGEERSFTVVRPDGGNRINMPDGRFTGDSPRQCDAWMYHVGKKFAGRLLDGVEHSEFPAERSALGKIRKAMEAWLKLQSENSKSVASGDGCASKSTATSIIRR